ncbi:hypothetical protein Ancab_023230 [Ancistrocladus abbreviatus]
MSSSMPTDLSQISPRQRRRLQPESSSASNPPPSPVEKVFYSDLLIVILLLLPARTLVKLKSVCRRWNSVISSAEFSVLHTSLYPPTTSFPSGIFLHRSSFYNFCYQFLSLSSLSLSPPFPFRSKALQSCNGLVLTCIRDGSNDPRDFYVYNPTTRMSKQLPTSPRIKFDSIFGVCLAFQPPELPHYIVVCVCSTTYSAYDFRINVYHSDTGCWKEWSGNDFEAPYDMVFCNGVYLNGAVHWISLREKSLYFDVVNELLVQMPSPHVSKHWVFGDLCECGGQLCYVVNERRSRAYYEVYMMESYEAGWSLRYNVDVDAAVADFPEMFGIRVEYLVLSVAQLGNEGRLIMLVHAPGKLFVYDLQDGILEKLCDVELQQGDAPGKPQFGWYVTG